MWISVSASVSLAVFGLRPKTSAFQDWPAGRQPERARRSRSPNPSELLTQCECGRPVPQRPQEEGVPVQDDPSDESSPPPEAKTESFLVNRLDPHFGQEVPSH